ncbi:MAG: tRNA (N(6)-L-threonylcarbamoyladenosine(37)-C(2))-methylthiotransferase MtaB [Defluviitaleaceae bacterium]|nr:tRNA (N(6)-L-threonylcarbamoyladenosine(37)-C(2))-methylthiotransferase MtaB [Defluviitaleaceae bacterium]
MNRLQKKTIAARTLGCKVNAYDTEATLSMFAAAGYTIVDFERGADVYIVNTCTVTAVSDRKSRQAIRRTARTANASNSIVVVMGCYSKNNADEVRDIEGVNIVIGMDERDKIVELVENYAGNTDTLAYISKDGRFLSQLISFSGTRASIKVQDGCDNYCAYCIIPHVRGCSTSRSPIEIVKEVQNLADHGCKEIVLTGISLDSYRFDDTVLSDIIRKVTVIDGVRRIRISSINPNGVTPALLAAFKDVPKLCPHVHLSLQSGCDKTLRAMNRHYTTEEYRRAVTSLRTVHPDMAVTTDIIVGFPGETDIDFEESLAFAKSIGFAAIHTFPFSPRKGTAAAEMPGKVKDSLKTKRVQEMLTLAERLKIDFINLNIGKTFPVLYEKQLKTGNYVGYTPNYLEVYLESDINLQYQILDTRIIGYSHASPPCKGIICQSNDIEKK